MFSFPVIRTRLHTTQKDMGKTTLLSPSFIPHTPPQAPSPEQAAISHKKRRGGSRWAAPGLVLPVPVVTRVSGRGSSETSIAPGPPEQGPRRSGKMADDTSSCGEKATGLPATMQSITSATPRLLACARCLSKRATARLSPFSPRL